MDFKTRLGLLYVCIIHREVRRALKNNVLNRRNSENVRTHFGSSITCTFYMNIWVEA